MAVPPHINLAQQASGAVRAMQAVTGCSALEALQVLLALAVDDAVIDKDQRIDALDYLIRTQPKPRPEDETS